MHVTTAEDQRKLVPPGACHERRDISKHVVKVLDDSELNDCWVVTRGKLTIQRDMNEDTRSVFTHGIHYHDSFGYR